MQFINDNPYLVVLLSLFLIIMSLPSFIKWTKKRKFEQLMIRSGIREIDRMSGYSFEEYLMVLFKELGYKPQITKKSGDFGADVVLKGRNKIVIQAKRYGFKNRVSLDAIREIYAAKAFYQADEAWVITNSFFTKQALELAKACEVKLLNRYDLQNFMIEVDPNKR